MLCDVPHFKSICLIGAIMAVVGTVGLAWAYPAFCDKVADYRQSKTVEVWQDHYGISAGSSAPLVRSGTALSKELAASVPEMPSGVVVNASTRPLVAN